MGMKTSGTSSDTPIMGDPHPLLAHHQNRFLFDLAPLVHTYLLVDSRYHNPPSHTHRLLRIAVIPIGMGVCMNKDHRPAGGRATDVEVITMFGTALDDDEDYNISCRTRNVRRELMLQRSSVTARLFFFFPSFPLLYQAM